MALAFCSGAVADDASLAAFGNNFVCPESLPSDEARQAALIRFFSDVGKVAPSMGIVEVAQLRTSLLRNHRCQKTLDNVAAADQAIKAGAVFNQVWISAGSNGKDEVFVSLNELNLIADPRYP